MLYYDADGMFLEWNGEPIDNKRHPLNIGSLWSAEELAAIGLYDPVRPPVPAGKRKVSEAVARVNGVVQFVYELEDIISPVDEAFPPLEPWQFWSIIDLSGVGEQTLRDAITRIPDEAFKVKALRKLANPPGGKFHRSDPLFNNPFLMMQLHMTEEEINALWLQAGALE